MWQLERFLNSLGDTQIDFLGFSESIEHDHMRIIKIPDSQGMSHQLSRQSARLITQKLLDQISHEVTCCWKISVQLAKSPSMVNDWTWIRKAKISPFCILIQQAIEKDGIQKDKGYTFGLLIVFSLLIHCKGSFISTYNFITVGTTVKLTVPSSFKCNI